MHRTSKYCNLPFNSHGLYSSHPWIIASGCCANTVINAAACIWPLNQTHLILWNSCMDCISFYFNNVPFHLDILHRSISAMCYIYHCSYETCDTYKSTSSASNLIFYSGYVSAGKAISVHEQVLAIWYRSPVSYIWNISTV